MSNLKMTLKGMDDVEKQLARIERATKSMGQWKGYIGSRRPYAWGQEFGRHRVSGKLARRAGGAFYLQGAVNAVLSDADRDLAEGLNKVTAPGRWVIKRLALWTRRIARLKVPRKSGKLRRSINIDVRR